MHWPDLPLGLVNADILVYEPWVWGGILLVFVGLAVGFTSHPPARTPYMGETRLPRVYLPEQSRMNVPLDSGDWPTLGQLLVAMGDMLGRPVDSEQERVFRRMESACVPTKQHKTMLRHLLVLIIYFGEPYRTGGTVTRLLRVLETRDRLSDLDVRRCLKVLATSSGDRNLPGVPDNTAAVMEFIRNSDIYFRLRRQHVPLCLARDYAYWQGVLV